MYRACGGNWGGTAVDDEFQQYLENFYGKEAVLNFYETAPSDALDFQRDYENQKRQIATNADDELKIKIPPKISIEALNIHQKETTDANKMGSTASITPFLMSGIGAMTFNTHIAVDIIKEFFNPALQYITDHIKFILQTIEEKREEEEQKKLKLILLVGGFSESDYLREKLQEAFHENIFVIPENAGLSVLKGAVMFGFKPLVISARISRFTYGAEGMIPYRPNDDPKEKLKIVGGEKYCKDIFKILVREGELVEINEKRNFRSRNRLRPTETKKLVVSTSIYASKTKYPKYTTDEGCQLVGKFEKEPPAGGWADEAEFTTDVYFGRTDILVCTRDITNKREFSHNFRLPYDD